MPPIGLQESLVWFGHIDICEWFAKYVCIISKIVSVIEKLWESLYMQCPKLTFYRVHSQGAFPIKLCTRKMVYAPSQYIAIINSSKNVHTPGAHLQKACTWSRKCARRVQGAPLISDTVHVWGEDIETHNPSHPNLA